ncbi:GTP-binding protein [Renibacterium salmoninarum]|nr:GTP-binding protein [Renibacterium salmoninarum]
MPTLNLGILAHVDAGKTTLTEQLLFKAGVSDHLGRVDNGDTHTDDDDIERRRGITIRSAIASFIHRGVRINVIDTPGHADFVAEVERAVSVLDAAVLVLSAVEGLQAQSRVLLSVLTERRIPCLIFINKIDRSGARDAQLIEELRARVDGVLPVMNYVSGLSAKGASICSWSAHSEGPENLLAELAETDEQALEAYLAGPKNVERSSTDRMETWLGSASRSGLAHPVFFGSALAGVGVGEFMDALTWLLPAAEPNQAAPLHGTVFKVARDQSGRRSAYLCLDAGSVQAQDTVEVFRRVDAADCEPFRERLSRVQVIDHGTELLDGKAAAGRIALVSSRTGLLIGDQLGSRSEEITMPQIERPGLEAVVRPGLATQKRRLHEALLQLTDEDPLVGARLDPGEGESVVNLYGQIQQEVI